MSGEVKKKGKFGPKGKGKKDHELNGGSLEVIQGTGMFLSLYNRFVCVNELVK
jgi:hypothetical protein